MQLGERLNREVPATAPPNRRRGSVYCPPSLHAAERSPANGPPWPRSHISTTTTNTTCYDLTLNLFIAHLVLATNTSHVVQSTEGIDACSYFARAFLHLLRLSMGRGLSSGRLLYLWRRYHERA